MVGVDPEKKKLTGEPGREVGPVKLTPESLPQVWRQIVDQAGFATKGDLQAAVAQRISGPTSLVLTFPHGYNLPNDARRVQMEQLVAKITGETWTVQSELDATHPVASAPAAPQESPSQKRRREQEEVMKLPLLAKMKETLGAAVIGMDEGFGQVAAATKTVPVEIDEDVFVETMDDD